jgi:hypothetical protein
LAYYYLVGLFLIERMEYLKNNPCCQYFFYVALSQ